MDIRNNELPSTNTIKKNRTIQFYKFLLTSLKIEISLNEFMKLVKYSNQWEIGLWIISIFIYYADGASYPIVWLHFLHLIRGICGVAISIKLPKSFELISLIEEDDKLMENKVFNDIIRDTVKKHFLPRIVDMKSFLLAYFALTFVNFMIDIVDFLYIISNLNSFVIDPTIILIFLIFDVIYISTILLNFSN